MHKLESQTYKSKLQTSSEDFKKNKDSMLGMLKEIDILLDEAEAGGGPDHHERLAARGKLPVRKRIFHFLDPDCPFLEISGLAGYKSDYPVGGGAVAGIGVCSGKNSGIVGKYYAFNSCTNTNSSNSSSSYWVVRFITSKATYL